jgi:hypothetical protein
MRNQDTDKALKKIRAAYLRAQVITAMDEQWDSILALDEEPFEALYKFCDLELGISPDSPGGGIFSALNNEALFVALTRDGVRVASVPEFATPRNMRRPEAPAIVGLVIIRGSECVPRPFRFWERFGLYREAAVLSEFAGRTELLQSDGVVGLSGRFSQGGTR